MTSKNLLSTVETKGSCRALKIGSILAVIGGLGYFASLLMHGDLPDQTTEIALQHIAERPEWRYLKLSLIVSLLCWIGSFEALSQSMECRTSSLFARCAVGSGIIGASIVIVEYAIIGHALKDVADRWSSTGAESETQLIMAEIMLAISKGLFHSFVAWMIGLPFILLGLAIANSPEYPHWFGWTAVLLGSGALLAGVTRFLGMDLIPYPLLYGGFVIPLAIWLTALGGFMWIKASSNQT